MFNNWTLLRLLLYLSINVFATGEGFHPDIRSGPTVSQFVRGGSLSKQRLGIKIEIYWYPWQPRFFFTVSCFARCLIYIIWLIFLLWLPWPMICLACATPDIQYMMICQTIPATLSVIQPCATCLTNLPEAFCLGSIYQDTRLLCGHPQFRSLSS